MSKNDFVTKEQFDEIFALEKAKLEETYAGNDMTILGANWFACTACRATIKGTLSAAIIAALATGAAEAIAAIAAATGLVIEVVAHIIAELVGQGILEALDKAIFELCKAMGACD